VAVIRVLPTSSNWRRESPFRSLKPVEAYDLDQFRIRCRPVRTDTDQIDSDDMAEVIDASAIREPFQPQWALIRLEVGIDITADFPDCRRGIALDMSLVDDPTEGDPDQ
jgi:hypothetical protein